jgi:hypothetical protein
MPLSIRVWSAAADGFSYFRAPARSSDDEPVAPNCVLASASTGLPEVARNADQYPEA